MRTFERAFRRCRLPVALSQGHNPRPRLRFVFPSAVGMAAQADVLFVDLTSPALENASSGDDPTTCDLGKLNSALPDGLLVRDACPVPSDRRKSALAEYSVAEYRIVCDCPSDASDMALEQAAGAFGHTSTITAQRGGTNAPREVEVGRYLKALSMKRTGSTEATISLTTIFDQSGTLRPGDVVHALAAGLPGLALRSVERTRITGS